MEVSSGLIRVSRGSKEESELLDLILAVKDMPEDFLVRYRNEIIKLGYAKTYVQENMLNAIAIVKGDVRLERY